VKRLRQILGWLLLFGMLTGCQETCFRGSCEVGEFPGGSWVFERAAEVQRLFGHPTPSSLPHFVFYGRGDCNDGLGFTVASGLCVPGTWVEHSDTVHAHLGGWSDNVAHELLHRSLSAARGGDADSDHEGPEWAERGGIELDGAKLFLQGPGTISNAK
jgi:hypothetical protein